MSLLLSSIIYLFIQYFSSFLYLLILLPVYLFTVWFIYVSCVCVSVCLDLRSIDDNRASDPEACL